MALKANVERFRGCLMGGLIGDCLGAPFEFESLVDNQVLTKFIADNLNQNMKHKQEFPYTDDTAMVRSLANSLIEKKEFDANHIAHSFAKEYSDHPKRGYGSMVKSVLSEIKKHYEKKKGKLDKDKDEVYGFAAKSNSFGNGAAMRTSPIALFAYYASDEQIKRMTTNCAKITHSHRDGINGAILQCLAIHQALKTKVNPKDYSFERNNFLKELTRRFNVIEKESVTDEELTTPYSDQLKTMTKLVEDTDLKKLTKDEIVRTFSNGFTAPKSVATAICCVLRAQHPIDEYPEAKDPFIRTLYLSISLGGDTDTIACMALSIAGALYGHLDLIVKVINALKVHCEGSADIDSYAQQLFKLAESRKK